MGYFQLRAFLGAFVPCSLLVASVGFAQEGTLRFGSMRHEDNRFSVPIMLSGGQDQVAALNFRLQYDPEVFRPVSAESGSAASQANKVVVANSPSPGNYVVVMMGLNQTTVQQGEVARVWLERVGSAENGQSELVIREPTLSTPEGMELPSRGMSRTVELDKPEAGKPDTAPEGEGEANSPEQEEPSTTPETPEQAEPPAPGTVPRASGSLLAANADGHGADSGATGGDSSAKAGHPSEQNAQPSAADDSGLQVQISEVEALRAALPTPGEQQDQEGIDLSSGGAASEPREEAVPSGAVQRERMAALTSPLPLGAPASALPLSEEAAAESQPWHPGFRTIIYLFLAIIALACGALVVVNFRRSG